MLFSSYQNYQRNLRDRQQLERLQEAAGAGEPDVIDAPAENTEQPNANANTTESNAENNQRNDTESTPLINSDADSSTTPSTAPSTPSAEQDENRLPTVTLLRTFILSFFSSLIPETPAV